MEQNSFCMGTFYGVVLGAVLVAILYQIRDARVRAGARDRTLDRFPAAVQPTTTPIGVVRTSRAARWAVVGLTLILIIFMTVMLVGGVFLISG